MRVLITGSSGFIGKNLATRLGEMSGFEVLTFDIDDDVDTIPLRLEQAEAIVHLAGINRPKNVDEFAKGNVDLTVALCSAILASGRTIPLILSSSVQAELDNPYGRSKLLAEQVVEKLAEKANNPVVIYRLPGVFGKWCKPQYNSVVATFCNNIANDLPVQIDDPTTCLRLVHVDDVVSEFINALESTQKGLRCGQVAPEYTITLGDLATQIEAFKNCRTSLISERVGTGLVRALYSTFVSYLPKSKFVYDVPCYGDDRGVFVEMLKTKDSGQFSYFTALPGVTRGGHYHHCKTEKFLVISGSSRFGFRNIQTNEIYELFTSGEVPQVVETVPGWTHDITNVGQSELIVMLWANEIFDRDRPDTLVCKV